MPIRTIALTAVLFVAADFCEVAAQVITPDSVTPIIEIRLARDTAGAGFQPMQIAASNERYFVADVAIVSDPDILAVEAEHRDSGLLISVSFSDPAHQRFLAAVRTSGIGGRLAILLEGELVSVPTIMTIDLGPRAVIAAELPAEQAERILASIDARWPR